MSATSKEKRFLVPSDHHTVRCAHYKPMLLRMFSEPDVHSDVKYFDVKLDEYEDGIYVGRCSCGNVYCRKPE